MNIPVTEEIAYAQLTRKRVNLQLILIVSRVLDVLLVASAGFGTYLTESALRQGLHSAAAEFSAVTIMAILCSPQLFSPESADDVLRKALFPQIGGVILRAGTPFLLVMLLTVLAIPKSAEELSQPLTGWLLTWAAIAMAAVAASRLVLYLLVRRWRAQGAIRELVAIVGSDDSARNLVDWLKHHCTDRVEILGVFAPSSDASSLPWPSSGWRGDVNELIELSKATQIDRILLASPSGDILEVLRKLKQIPVDISWVPDQPGLSPIRGNPEFADLPMVDVFGRPLNRDQQVVKSGFDFIVALATLVILSPVLLLAMIAIKLDSPGPILFTQERYGLGHRIIKVHKLRTMFADQADYGATQQARRGDPRVTRVGRFLRKTSIDELPQLLNVVRGEMSLVGPRPMALQMRVCNRPNHEAVAEYAGRHRVKPGVTGWAQVNGYRGAIESVEELKARVAHDLYYIDNWSLWLDIKIILMTVRTLAGDQNAF